MGVIPIQEFHLEFNPAIRVIGVENPQNDSPYEEASIVENQAFSNFVRERTGSDVFHQTSRYSRFKTLA